MVDFGYLIYSFFVPYSAWKTATSRAPSKAAVRLIRTGFLIQLIGSLSTHREPLSRCDLQRAPTQRIEEAR